MKETKQFIPIKNIHASLKSMHMEYTKPIKPLKINTTIDGNLGNKKVIIPANMIINITIINQFCLGIIASGIGFVLVQSRFRDIRPRL
ncbi:hypothetical protein [Lysinibacillus xylanilyticus]|uniref:Uncharacterized protein n=1 Tax=Lysinibacillus xylanilyticus TaxID=582475 RepID=A0ABT4ELB1_9BACI|nr:hypothetical protein [Lysinibacillus xylanilyticus]MCY9546401.1 hypothetical protein [Lysinibacillus xylanilyticus]